MKKVILFLLFFIIFIYNDSIFASSKEESSLPSLDFTAYKHSNKHEQSNKEKKGQRQPKKMQRSKRSCNLLLLEEFYLKKYNQ